MRRSLTPHGSLVDLDPSDPSQILDDAAASRDEVDAQPAADAEADLEAAIAESAEPGEPLDEDVVGDVGELYGVHTPPAVDKEPPGYGDATSASQTETGENWLEALEATSAENGAEPERELDVTDEDDETPHHSTDTRDRPVADRGAGGPAGL
jgi:hypothetical protein